MIDNYLQELIKEETNKLNDTICLIASENYPSQDILDLEGSVMSVPYTEGFPKEVSKSGRHYAGCEVIDKLENYAIQKACELFRVKYACMQATSGTHANQIVYHAFCKPGDRTLSGSLSELAHLSHGSKFTYSGRFYENYNYNLVNELIDYDEIKRKLYEVTPRLLIMGYSAYSRRIDFERIREIVDEYNEKVWKYHVDRKFSDDFVMKDEYTFYAADNYVSADTPFCPGFNVKKGMTKQDIYDTHKCILWTDMAHFGGFIAAHLWKDKYDPTIWSDVVTTTTHKTIRGARSAIILWNNEEYCKKINQSAFPANGGGYNQAMTAAKAQTFVEALTPSFRDYMEQVYLNMQAVINGIKDVDKESKIRFVSGGSENHMILLDMKGIGLTGKQAENLLESYNIICNKNMISGDLKPADCTGIRIGTPAITTRGFDESMSFELGRIIARILLRGKPDFENGVVDFESESIRSTVKKMLDKVGPFYKAKKVEKLLQDNDPNMPDDLA